MRFTGQCTERDEKKMLGFLPLPTPCPSAGLPSRLLTKGRGGGAEQQRSGRLRADVVKCTAAAVLAVDETRQQRWAGRVRRRPAP